MRPAPVMETLPDADAACRAVAECIAHAAGVAVGARGRFALAVSGGSSPIPAFALLAGALRDRVPWNAVHIWLTDERCVPTDHEESNFGMLRRELLDHVGVPPEQVHRFEGERAPADAADRAEAALRRAVGDRAGDDAEPLFDFVLLGVGNDGHTASLFPDGRELAERDRLVIAVEPPPGITPAVPRVTLTLPALESTREVLVLAYGAEKRDAVRAGWRGTVPAGRIHGREGTMWFVDRAAAGEQGE